MLIVIILFDSHLWVMMNHAAYLTTVSTYEMADTRSDLRQMARDVSSASRRVSSLSDVGGQQMIVFTKEFVETLRDIRVLIFHMVLYLHLIMSCLIVCIAFRVCVHRKSLISSVKSVRVHPNLSSSGGDDSL